MPSKPSRAKYLMVINLPHGVAPEPLPRSGPWWGLLTAWKDGDHWQDPAWLWDPAFHRHFFFWYQQQQLQGFESSLKRSIVTVNNKQSCLIKCIAAAILFIKKGLKVLCLRWQITSNFYF